MSRSLSIELVTALKAGNLEGVRAALDAGADFELRDDHGHPGLPLRMAAFMGHQDIVRELVKRGANVNQSSSASGPGGPISLAVRGGKKDTVRLLLELGAKIPPGLQTGLSLPEILAAQGVANRNGTDQAPTTPHPTLSGGLLAPITTTDLGRTQVKAGWIYDEGVEIEEIDLKGRIGVDTQVLDADLLRLTDSDIAAKDVPLAEPPLNFDKAKAPQR